MLRLFTASLLIASALSHLNPEIKPRKSLSFAPVLPCAVFDTNPALQQSFVFPQDTCLKVVRSFVIELIGRQQNDFTIRKDSYTDRNTGVTHVYVRQLVNGLEVADGDINVNVKEGTVLSYGNSVSICRIRTRCSAHPFPSSIPALLRSRSHLLLMT
jgi:extracellular elastinolytic metalloproteinase